MSKLYLISGVLWYFWDISKNMVNCILDSDILFVEELDMFTFFTKENKIDFKWEVYQLWINNNNYNKLILDTFLKWKNIWVFESSWIPCFVDPWLDVLQYVYELKNKDININIVYVPWGSALTAALSLCWFNIDKFSFLYFLSSDSKNEVLSSPIPVVYFLKNTDFHRLLDYLSFMKDITDKKAFCGINISKWMKFWDIIVRDTYKNAYLQIEKIYKECLDIWETPDFVFVFNK